MEFSKQEYWSGLLFPSPRALLNSGTEPQSPALQAYSLLTESQGKTNRLPFTFFRKKKFIQGQKYLENQGLQPW